MISIKSTIWGELVQEFILSPWKLLTLLQKAISLSREEKGTFFSACHSSKPDCQHPAETIIAITFVFIHIIAWPLLASTLVCQNTAREGYCSIQDVQDGESSRHMLQLLLTQQFESGQP